ncbi:MAG: hypothetical protein HFF52_08745 [Lawsonibacter sp.]|nr:hypothetical protein [Lawsonibacter sp.]
MIKRRSRERTLALSMAVLMTAVSVLPAGAAPIGDGVTPTCDEAYYATLDYYGNLMEGSIVKSYALNGAASFTDYGAYDEVVNLTDATPIALNQGSAAIRFDQAPDHFYFEGKTSQPFQTLPWTVTIRYTLNGVPVRAEELAGQRGVVEIGLDLVPNEKASDYARYNYTLEAMALFNEDDILSLEAEGAQVQLVGNLRSVLFVALPGEEQHFTIRVGSNDFSFGGMTILMVPATLAQLKEIAKLSQRKDELEEDYQALSGSLDALLDSLNAIQGGLYASASGLDQLNVARGTISSGKGLIYDGAGVLRGDLSNIADLLEPVEQRAQVLSQTITDSKGVLNDLTDTALTLKAQLDNLDSALQALESGAGDVKDLLRSAVGLKESLTKLEKALNNVDIDSDVKIKPIDPIDPGIGDTSARELVKKVQDVHGAYAETNRRSFFEAMLKLQGSSDPSGTAAKMEAALAQYPLALEAAEIQVARAALAESLPDTANMTDEEIKAAVSALPGEQQAAIKAKAKELVDAEFAKNPDWAAVQQLSGLFQAKEGMSFQAFCEKLPGVSKDQAKQMADLWTIYSGGARSGGLAAGAVSGRSGGLLAGALAVSTLSGDVVLDNLPAEDGAESASQAETPQEEIPQEETPQETGTTADSSADSSSASGGADQGGNVGGAVVDIIAGTLDQASSKLDSTLNSINNTINRSIRDINRQLADLQDELNDALQDVARPTADLVGELAGLCDQVDNLVELVDDAADVSAALRQFSPVVKSILDETDAMRTLLNGYEPTLQEGLANVGRLSTGTVSALRDMETMLSDLESLMKTSGEQLDDGTQQALHGLSATLRQTARALSTTQNVKSAKNTLTGIIEDTWHEYTGDINNILMMDAEAKPVSLTDARNPAPSSIQVLIRTQEIKAEETEPEAVPLSAREKTTFWERVARMFQDFWKTITSIFH